MPASTTCAGVSKSGSPISRWMTLLPLASSVLPDTANLGYQELRDLIVERVNGRPVASLQDLRQAFATPIRGFHVVEFLAGQSAVKIVLDASEAAAARQRLQQAYGVERLDSEPREPAQSLSR